MKSIVVLTVLLSFFFGHGQKSKLSAEHYQNVEEGLPSKDAGQQCRSSVQCTDKKSRQ